MHLGLDYGISNAFVAACYNGNFSAHFSKFEWMRNRKRYDLYVLRFVDLSRMFARQIADGKADMIDE